MTEKPQFDSLAFIMAWEQGDLNEEDIVAGFQELVDSGLVWKLQGCYGRQATALIEAGLIYYDQGN